MNDFSRQTELFDKDMVEFPITIIGAGATGSWLALILAKLGLKNITVYDFDRVEEHNLPNQFYGEDDVKEFKIKALRRNIVEQTGTAIKIQNCEIKDNVNLEGFVFVLTDTMHSRKNIFENLLENNDKVLRVVETRMGLTHGRIYFINPNDEKQVEKYKQTFYSDEESAVSFCGTSQSIVTTAIGIAQLAANKLIKYVNNSSDIYNEILIDFEYLTVIQTNF